MYIAPNTVVKLYKNVPLDNTYKHTIYFRSPQAQLEYFHGTPEILKYTLNELSYQRVGKGVIRVGRKAEDLFDCNYLAFQNTAFGNKWFYAFITKTPEYVNDTTCEIQYEIDVMQTYLGDVSFKPTYVEREMSVNDEIGENTLPEPVDIGDVIGNGTIRTGLFDSYSIVFVFSDASRVKGRGGIPQICNFVIEPLNNYVDFIRVSEMVENWVNGENQYINKLMNVFMFPSYFIPPEINNDYSVKIHDSLTYVRPNMIGNYTPRNRKLLTYPYNFLVLDNGNTTAEFRYEYFQNNNIQFKMYSEFSGNPKISILPVGYNNGDTSGQYFTANYQEQLIMEGFPQIAWSNDSYAQWIATQGTNTVLQAMVKVLTAFASGYAVGGVGVGIAGAVGTGIGQGISFKREASLAEKQANQTQGSNTGSTSIAVRSQDVYFMSKQIKPENARIIDDFFDVYGYACNRVKIPNLTSRRHWNYVKTRGANLFGNIPADDLQKLKSIYDNGITCWFTPSEVGNYALDNRPYV